MKILAIGSIASNPSLVSFSGDYIPCLKTTAKRCVHYQACELFKRGHPLAMDFKKSLYITFCHWFSVLRCQAQWDWGYLLMNFLNFAKFWQFFSSLWKMLIIPTKDWSLRDLQQICWVRKFHIRAKFSICAGIISIIFFKGLRS